MWELYNLLGTWRGKKFLVDEVLETLKTIPPDKFNKSFRLMYDTVSNENPAMLAVLFIRGLKSNKFFEFQMFIESLHASRS